VLSERNRVCHSSGSHMVLQQAFHVTEEQRSLLFLSIFSLQYDPTLVWSTKLAVLNFCFYLDLIPFTNVSGPMQISCVWITLVSCWTFSYCTHSERLYYLDALSCSVTQKQKSLELKMGHFSRKTIASTFKDLLAVWASALSCIEWKQFLFFRQPNPKSMPKSITGNLKFHLKNCCIISS
jgi:hypothetical protein